MPNLLYDANQQRNSDPVEKVVFHALCPCGREASWITSSNGMIEINCSC